MKILFLTPRIPRSGVAGGLSLVFQRITRLAARGHQVGLLSLAGADEKTDRDDPLFSSLADFDTAPRPRPAPLPSRAVRLMFSTIPPYVQDFRSPEMMRKVGDRVHEGRYDLVIAEFMAMGQYLCRNPYLPAARKIISSHFAVARTFESVAQTLGFSPRGLRSRANVNRLLNFEREMYRSVDRLLVFTAHEKYQWLNVDPTLRINVIPCGVDADYFRPVPEAENEEALVFTGHYEEPSNVDAATWFAATTWPLLKRRRPRLKWYVVGPGGPRKLSALPRRDDSIVVTGEVEDVRPYLRRAKVYICPVRQGAGIRFKLFEAMAAGIPVVTTTLGAEGIPMQNGDNCFLADKPEIMAQYIELLLDDENLRRSISGQARELVATRFNWDHGIDLLESVIKDVFVH